MIKFLYTLWLSKKLLGKYSPRSIFFSRETFRIKIFKKIGAHIEINGQINFRSHLGNIEPIRIILEEGAQLFIDGDFEIEAVSVILIKKNAYLRLGGKKNETAAGMSSNCKILVKNNVNIGYDVIMGWDILVTDSDCHYAIGSELYQPVLIEDKAWLGHHVSVYKGVKIGAGSIIAAHSLVLHNVISQTLSGGFPEKQSARMSLGEDRHDY